MDQAFFQGIGDSAVTKRKEVKSPLSTFINQENILKILLQYRVEDPNPRFWFSKFEKRLRNLSVQFSSVTQSCLTLCDPMDCSMPGFPVHHQILEHAQTHVHRVGDAIQPSHPLLFPSPAFNLSQHQGLFQGVSSSHQVAKVLEFQRQHHSFQWTPRTDLL